MLNVLTFYHVTINILPIFTLPFDYFWHSEVLNLHKSHKKTFEIFSIVIFPKFYFIDFLSFYTNDALFKIYLGPGWCGSAD